MLNYILLAAVAFFLFSSDSESTQSKDNNQKSYQGLVKDLMENHGMTQSGWKDNIRINRDLDGFAIGSDDGFILLSDKKPIKIYINKVKTRLNTFDTNEAVEKMKLMLNSSDYTNENKAIINKILNLLLKYKNYYYFTKYLKYKNKYNLLKKSN